MAAETNSRVTSSYGDIPHVVTRPVAANEEIIKGCFVADTGSYAVDYSDDGNGYTIIGVASAGVDNRTTAPSGGGAGAEVCDIRQGVFEFAYTGSAPAPGDIVYGVDNQTVSLTATSVVSGYRGVAGIVVQTDTTHTTCRVFCSVLMQDVRAYAAIVTALAASVGTDDSAGDLFTRIALAEVDLSTVEVPLGSLRLSTGAAIGAFADNTTDGFELSGSECLGVRWNNDTAPRITVAGTFTAPANWDEGEVVTAYFDGFRVGSADAAMVGTVTLFAQEVGDVYTVDANAGGSTTAFNGATTVITRESLEIAAGAIPAGSKVSFTFVPDAALDGDDFVLTGIRFVGSRASA